MSCIDGVFAFLRHEGQGHAGGEDDHELLKPNHNVGNAETVAKARCGGIGDHFYYHD
jgi:hypothetical protein